MKRHFNTLLKLTAVGSALAIASQAGTTAVGGETPKAGTERKSSREVTAGRMAEHPSSTDGLREASKPNIVYIVLDDMGFSDLGSYGAEIKTPNIDKLAENGLRYVNFNTCPLSSPTRASLLTGRDNNAVGMGFVANMALGPDRPTVQGRIKPQAATIAEILREQNFSTLGVGKWHVGPLYQATPAGPFDNWPLGKGFERFYGFLDGETDQYTPQLIYDNHVVAPTKTERYTLSKDLIDKAIQFVTDQVSIYPNKPFFLYTCFGTAHSPQQVPQSYIDSYGEVYDKGWDKLREERYQRQLRMGIIPPGTRLPARDASVPEWESLSPGQKQLYVRFMQNYAGYVTHCDEQIGRLVEFLKSIGKLDNTMIILISDNGATDSGGVDGIDTFVKNMNGMKGNLEELMARIGQIGGPDMQALYPKGWAQVSNTPFQKYKASTYAGGTREPLIIHWPKGVSDKGKIRTSYVHVTDITPTALEVEGIKAPETLKGVRQMPMHGVSFAATLKGREAPAQRTRQYYFMGDSRAIYDSGWKAIATHAPRTTYEEDKWELYHVAEDYSESTNVAAMYPEKLQSLKKLWMTEADKYGILPLTEISLRDLTYVPPDSPASKTFFKYLPGMEHLGVTAAPPISNKSYTITVPVTRPEASTEGVLVALGDEFGGYTLYVKDNRLVYEYNNLGTLHRIVSETELPVGAARLRFEFRSSGFCAGIGTLYIDEQAVGQSAIKTALVLLSFEGLDIGRDTLSPASKSYADKGDFAFTGQIESVTFEIVQRPAAGGPPPPPASLPRR
jgi:arylsulfatase A-like enzyme